MSDHNNKGSNQSKPLATMHAIGSSGNSNSSSNIGHRPSNETSGSTTSTSSISFKSSALKPSTPATNNHDVIPLPTRMVLSAFAGMGAATLCHPLDVVRVQLQTSSARAGAFSTMLGIYQTSGVFRGLYAGLSAAYLRQWLYGSCRMGIYSYLLEQERQKHETVSFANKLWMGSVSGAVGSFVGTPSEVALVRMSADSKLPVEQRRNYQGVFNCLARMAREEGISQLWKGATPTVARVTVLSSCSMGITSQVKGYLQTNRYFRDSQDQELWGGLPTLFCATLVSSFCATIATNPFDVIKSRLQQQTKQTTTMECLRTSLRKEGWRVLFAGFAPAFVKLAPYSIISLTLADKLTQVVTGKDAL